MSIIKFETLTSLFQSTNSEAAEKQLMKEVLLMVLARAASADKNVHPSEISDIQEVLLEVTGEDISEADIRVAGQSELFERQSLDRYLSKATRKLADEDRALILQYLIRVLHSDDHVREFEIDYFDRVANALKATPSEIAGLRLLPAR